MKLRKVLFSGSRGWADKQPVELALKEEFDIARRDGATLLVIHGNCATGLDQIIEELCRKGGIHTAKVDAIWERHGMAAGPVRNRVMVCLEPVAAHVFPYIYSKGTRDCIKALKAAGITTTNHGEPTK